MTDSKGADSTGCRGREFIDMMTNEDQSAFSIKT